MGAPKITDQELEQLGLEIVDKSETDSRKLHVPSTVLAQYEQLVSDKIDNGFWNDIVGEKEIIFIFKLVDGSVKRLVLSDTTKQEIAQLCSQLNGDPIEKTSDTLNYLAGNSFYKGFIETHYNLKNEKPEV